MSQLGDALELMHQARYRAMPFDITIGSRSRRGDATVRVRAADGRLRVDETVGDTESASSTLVQAEGRWLVVREDGTASTGDGVAPPRAGGPWMPVVELVIDPAPLLPQLEFEVVGDTTVGDREALLVHSRLRADDPFGLMGLPGWFDVPLDPAHPEYGERAGRYEIAIDAVRGILLDVMPLAPDPGTERLTVAAHFDMELDADAFSTMPPAGARITKVKSLWTPRLVAGIAHTLMTPKKRLYARAERERLANL
jgi:hypothetical protein